MNVLLITLLIFFSTSIESDDGSFRASVEYGGGTELMTESFVLYDRYDVVVYMKSNSTLNTFFISNTGSVFALNEHRLCFYHQDGREKMLKELVYPNGFGFSSDNSIFFASDREGLFAYSGDGNLVHKYRPGRLFTSSTKGENVAIISADTLFVHEDGSIIDTEFLSSPYASDLYYSADGKSIVVQIPGAAETYDIRTRSWVKKE